MPVKKKSFLIKEIKKRDGRVAPFNPNKILIAISKAMRVVGEGNEKKVKEMTNQVVETLEKRFDGHTIPEVEQIQDVVEEILIKNRCVAVVKAYILYRELHRKIRNINSLIDSDELVHNYIDKLDWRVRENSNMTYSLQGLNNHVASLVTSNFWLNQIYGRTLEEAHLSGDLHIHDLAILAAYCCGWDLHDFLVKGFGGVPGKVYSKPPKHLRAALGQLPNLIYTLQGETAGAQAVSNFDTLLAPFIYYDDLSYKEVKQSLQEFIFNMNVPTRVGFQTPFSNITLDLVVPSMMAKEPVIIGGEPQKKTYGEFQKEMNVFNQALGEVMLEGDAQGRVFSFPIPTINITKDFDWNNPYLENLWEATRKYGIPYFSNFINSDMKPEDARSMCPLAGDEKVLIRSRRGRNYEYSDIRHIYDGIVNSGHDNKYEVFSDGKFLTGKFNKFEDQQLLKITLVNGHQIRMSDQHLNYVLENKKVKIVKALDFKESMYLPYSLKTYGGEGGNYDLGYFVGAFAGDGSYDRDTSVVFSLENDFKKEVIENLERIAKDCFSVHVTKTQDKKTKLFTLKVHSQGAVGLCKDFIEGKEREKCYKAKLFGTSIDFRKGVIDGHYATDGGNRHRIYTSSLKMVHSLNMLSSTLGTTTAIYKDERDNRLGKEANFAVLIYQLNRENYGDFWKKFEGKLWVKIAKIEKSTKSAAFCFEVEKGEPIFTVGTTGILTHNCRLRLDNRELRKKGGGLFGANPLTGAVGVVTINMPRIGYLYKTKSEFKKQLGYLMDLAKESLIIKRRVVENFTEKGLYPYSEYFLKGIKERFGEYWKNHFNTIGLVGMNEACLNFLGENIGTENGKKFALEILDFMREKIGEYQKETNQLFNLEATPAEGTSYRFAREDRKRFKDIIFANNEAVKIKKAEPYYTNSTQLPVDYTTDIFEALEHQDELQCKYTGGCVEGGNKVLTNKGLLNIEYIVENFEKLKPIEALSYNLMKGVSEWDEIINAITIDVEKKNKIKIRGERALDIVTSDWHPFFVLEKVKASAVCPICQKKVRNIKSFVAHLRYNPDCRRQYSILPKYKVVEKRADVLKVGDYILQNSDNLYLNIQTELNNDLMWLIGFFIGDGCLSSFTDNRGGNSLRRYKIRFFSENKGALERAERILSKYFQTKAKVIQNDKRSKVLRELATSKKEVSEFFFKYGFKEGKKVYDVSISQEVKENLNKKNIFSLLVGLMDSDGFISKRDGDFEYYTVSSRLADDILEICTRAGIMISKVKKSNKRKNETSGWRLRIPSYQVTEIKDELTKAVKSFRIMKHLSDRKKRHLPVARVKEISKVDVIENKFYDLTTKKNHNYLAGKSSLVFIHNTVFHGFLGESLSDTKSLKVLVKKIAERFHLPYYTLTPTFSICQKHGYLTGEHKHCPRCDEEISQQKAKLEKEGFEVTIE